MTFHPCAVAIDDGYCSPVGPGRGDLSKAHTRQRPQGHLTASTAKMRGPSGFEVAFEGPMKGRRPPVFCSREGHGAFSSFAGRVQTQPSANPLLCVVLPKIFLAD